MASCCYLQRVPKIAEKYLTKGAKVLIEGKLATNKWKDNDGNDRCTTEVQVQPYNGTLTFLDTKKRDGKLAAGGNGGTREPAMAAAGDGMADDEIPFRIAEKTRTLER